MKKTIGIVMGIVMGATVLGTAACAFAGETELKDQTTIEATEAIGATETIETTEPIEEAETIDAEMTDTAEIAGEEISRVQLFRAVLEEFDKLYRELTATGFDKIIQRWKEYNITLGKNIKVISAIDGKSFTGKAVDLNADGALVVETEQGLDTVYAGDVSIR